MSREQVTEQTGVNEGTLYRLETARARPQRRTLVALLDLYGVSGDARTGLLDIAKSADDGGNIPTRCHLRSNEADNKNRPGFSMRINDAHHVGHRCRVRNVRR